MQNDQGLIELSKSGGRQPDTPSPQPSQTWGKAKTLIPHITQCPGQPGEELAPRPSGLAAKQVDH